MSQQRSGIPQPRGSNLPRPQQPPAGNQPPKPDDKKPDKPKKGDKKTIEFQLPALSIVGKKKEINFDEIRKKVIRRGNPEGEDKKAIKSVLKHLQTSKTKIRVHEFVNLVSKFTADNGETMRKVMEDDLTAFRKMVTKVYENMTQDVSDVLVNEQIQTTNFYQERYDMFNNKMLWMISEIFQMVPDFDFEKYAKDKDEFLNYVCPIPALIQRDADDIDLQKRQEAFHRLQWLKIEEKRLAEENRRLESRLDDLKNQHKRETTQSTMKTAIMEQKLHELEDEEIEKQEQLNELEGLLGKNIVRTEAYIRLEEDEASRVAKPLPREKKKTSERRKKTAGDWSSQMAKNMEEEAARNTLEAESALEDAKKRERRRIREPNKETTLFSEPPEKDYSEFQSVQRMEEKTIQRTITTIQEKRPKKKCGGGCQ